MDNLGDRGLEELLAAVGEHLAAARETASIVVIGGAALLLRGWIERGTGDVDVVARTVRRDDDRVLVPPEPLPDALVRAASTVARDYRLPEYWLNTGPAAQWKTGLPPDFEDELVWRHFDALEVGIAGRRSLIALKLLAAVDQGPNSVHVQDLTALDPREQELAEARDWVLEQDESEIFSRHVDEAIDHVQRDNRDDGPTGE